jgi:hypothetical protein
MIRFQADADLDHKIVQAARKSEPSMDFASALDSGLERVPDPEVLELAASQNRILVTHDRRTMPGYFRSRLAQGKSSPGVFLVSQFAALGPVVEALVTVWAASEPSDWRNQMRHVPSLSLHDFAG